MKHNVVTPSVGESITEVAILKWSKQSGQAVKANEVIVEIESDKATVEVVSPVNGVITILKPPGERLPIGELIATIDDAATATATPAATSTATPPPAPGNSGQPKAAPVGPTLSPSFGQQSSPALEAAGPAVRTIAAETGIDISKISGTGKDGRVTKGDVMLAGQTPTIAQPNQSPVATQAVKTATPASPMQAPKQIDGPGDRRVPMSMLRSKIAERLVYAQHTAAILTTFNEIDMKPVMDLRNQHKEAFKAKHGVPLSFMSFFARGCIEALKQIPAVNASIDGRDMIYHDYYDLGIAVGTERGLVVPVIRGAGPMGFVDIEKEIGKLAVKARDGKLSIADLSGGTFTISNGGTYGSLLSTPILNPPQSGILGMHKIQERPVAINGQVAIRPMMYVALSYDHRMIDGKEAVTFLVTLKDYLENPEKLAFSY